VSIASLYIHTLRHFRPTRTSDGQGGWAVGYETLADVVGRLRPASASERTVAAQEQVYVSHVLYCAADEDVQREDLLTLDNGAHPAVVVEVVAVREPSYSGHHLEIDAYQVQKPTVEELGS
jgi:head-tail adaptor